MSGETTSEFATEAEDARERIAATIDELQDRLDPRRIVGEAVGTVKAQGSDLVEEGVRLLRANPVVAAGAALAIGLAVLGQQRLKRATVDLGEGYEAYSDYDDDYAAREKGDAKGERFALLRERTRGSVSDNPLVAVIVGLAAGALLGAIFPETASERRLMATSSSKVTAAARAAARKAREELATARTKVADVTTHARGAVQSVVGAARSEFGDGR